MSAYKSRRCTLCGKSGAWWVPVVNEGYVHPACWRAQERKPMVKLEIVFEGCGEDGIENGAEMFQTEEEATAFVDKWYLRGYATVTHMYDRDRVFLVPWHRLINIEYA